MARSDTNMSTQLWTIITVFSLATVLGILHVVAGWVRSETHLQELRRRKEELRAQRLERKREAAETRSKTNKTDGGKAASGSHSTAA